MKFQLFATTYIATIYGINNMQPGQFTLYRTYVRSLINQIIVLLGQQSLLHSLWSTLGPEQSFPPHEGVGLSHVLVNVCVPPPQLLLHDPYSHELHPPSTIQ